MSANTSDSSVSPAAVVNAAPTGPTGPTGPERRVARVDRWLSKGFGFATDYGRLDTSGT